MRTPLIFFILIICLLDANAQWTEIKTTISYAPTDIYFADSMNGFISCSFGTVLKTNDGGKSWVSSTPASEALTSIFAVDKDTVYTARTTMYKTKDNCNTWSKYGNSDNWGATIFDIYFTNAATGFIIKSFSLYKSNDYGKSWKEVYNYAPKSSILFTSKDTGYVYGGDESNIWCDTYPCPSKSYGQLLRTTDGGESWQKLIFFNDSLNLVGATFFDNNHGVVITSHNTLHRTSNGGETWSMKRININPKITKGLFFNELIGYIITLDNKIYSTKDGGDSWLEEFSSNTDLYYMASTGKAIIIAGANGYILRNEVNSSQTVETINKTCESSVRIYPNPSTGIIHLSGIDGSKIHSFCIYNSLGQRCLNVKELSDHTMDLGQLPCGIYQVHLRYDDNKEFKTRITVSHH